MKWFWSHFYWNCTNLLSLYLCSVGVLKKRLKKKKISPSAFCNTIHHHIGRWSPNIICHNGSLISAHGKCSFYIKHKEVQQTDYFHHTITIRWERKETLQKHVHVYLHCLVESTLGVTVCNSSEVVSQMEQWVRGQGCTTFPLFVLEQLTQNIKKKKGCSKAGSFCINCSIECQYPADGSTEFLVL